MSAHRFFLTADLPSDPETPIPLCAADAHHAADVLRLRAGELIEVVEPGGRVLSLRVVDATRAGVRAAPVGEVTVASEPHVTLIQGVAKGDKMDAIVRQAVEVGAERIVPVLTSRSVVRLEGAKRAAKGERWRRVAESAAKQAKRTSVPEVADPIGLCAALPVIADHDAVLVLWEECEGFGIRTALSAAGARGDARVALVVGPEGGLSAEEVAQLAGVGGVAVSLGANILRTETAAVVGLALALEALGGMGAARA